MAFERPPFQLVVIGGGNMGAALLGGLLNSGAFAQSDVAVVEIDPERRTVLVAQFPGVTVTHDVPPCDAAVLAVKPYGTAAAATAAVECGAARVLSIAAGVTIDTISAATGPAVAVLRAMPNTPALVGQGVSALAGAPGVSNEAMAWAEMVLSAVGIVVRVDESQLDAVTGLTGSGPGYVFLVAEALIEAGVRVGLQRASVEQMVAQLLVGSAALLADRGDPATLRQMVTSPNGTTAAGLEVLEQKGVRAAIYEAVEAAMERSRELGLG